MKKKIFTLFALLCGVLGVYAEEPPYFSYTVNENSEAQTELSAGMGGTIYFGATGKFEEKEAGWGYKSDGNASATSTKYARIKLDKALAEGDVIKLTAFATSGPSGSDYGLCIYAQRADDVDPITTLYLPSKKKNVLVTLTYEVTAEDGLEGSKEFYVFRAKDKSTYINAVEIIPASNTGGGDEPEPVVLDKPTFVVNGVSYQSGSTVKGLKTGQQVTINVAEGQYIYCNWSSKTGGSKETYYTKDRLKDQTSCKVSTSTGGQRVLYAVAGDTDDAEGNSSDLAYIVFENVVPANPWTEDSYENVFYNSELALKRGCTDDVIYYTTDGTDPTTESTLLGKDETIVLNQPTMGIKAVAFDKSKTYPSNIVTFNASVVTKTVNITDAGYATLYCGTNDLVVPQDMQVFTVSVDDGQLVQSATFELNDVIPAGNGVVLKGRPGDYLFMCGTPAQDPEILADNMLYGYDKETMIDGPENCKYYKLAVGEDGVGFYPANQECGPFLSKGGKAYLAVPEALAASFFNFDGATGIKGMTATDAANEAVYNLQGVRMDAKNLQKGIYIVNGKKIVVK